MSVTTGLNQKLTQLKLSRMREVVDAHYQRALVTVFLKNANYVKQVWTTTGGDPHSFTTRPIFSSSPGPPRSNT